MSYIVVHLWHDVRTSSHRRVRTPCQRGHGAARGRIPIRRSSPGTRSTTWCLGTPGVAVCPRGGRASPAVGDSRAEGCLYRQVAGEPGPAYPGSGGIAWPNVELPGDRGAGSSAPALAARATGRWTTGLSSSSSMIVWATNAVLKPTLCSFRRKPVGFGRWETS